MRRRDVVVLYGFVAVAYLVASWPLWIADWQIMLIVKLLVAGSMWSGYRMGARR